MTAGTYRVKAEVEDFDFEDLVRIFRRSGTIKTRFGTCRVDKVTDDTVWVTDAKRNKIAFGKDGVFALNSMDEEITLASWDELWSFGCSLQEARRNWSEAETAAKLIEKFAPPSAYEPEGRRCGRKSRGGAGFRAHASFETLVQAAAAKLDLGPLETKNMSDKLKAYIKSLSELDGSKGKNLDTRITNLKAGIAKWAKKVRSAKTPVEKRKANFVLNGQRRALGWHLEAKKLQGKGE